MLIVPSLLSAIRVFAGLASSQASFILILSTYVAAWCIFRPHLNGLDSSVAAVAKTCVCPQLPATRSRPLFVRLPAYYSHTRLSTCFLKTRSALMPLGNYACGNEITAGALI